VDVVCGRVRVPPMTTRLNRQNHELRPLHVEVGVQRQAAGSCLIAFGNTRVLCAATLETVAPKWKTEPGGWVTAEYAMLPGSGDRRVPRRENGRATEIARLIGRSLRAAVDLSALGANTITIDCDVIDADGGTRTASITGGWIALWLAAERLIEQGKLASNPVVRPIAAVSVGMVAGEARLDLEYVEDSQAGSDINVVGNGAGALIEVQGTAESAAFSRVELSELLDLAEAGIGQLVALQRRYTVERRLG